MKYLIDFKNDSTNDQILNYLNQNSLTIIKQYSSFEKTYLIEAQALPPTDIIIEKIIEDAPNLVKPLNYDTYSVSVSNDTDDWWKIGCVVGLDLSLETSSYQRRGKSAVIYLLDSGVKSSHPEFEFSTIEHLYSMNGDFSDYNGHGTALASVICGKTCGITAATIKSVKIFQENFDTLQSHMLEALDAIYADYMQNNTKMSIVNISWTINKNLYIEEKIRFLVNSGLIVVASAGNSGTLIENVTPASMPDCTIVSAFDKNLEPCNFANYSSAISNTADMTNIGIVDLWAPGENIKIAGLDNNYSYGSGTSISAAIHSGALAYNTDWLMLEDGSIPKTSMMSKVFLNSLSASTNNILTLTDQYSSSVNKVSSYICVNSGINGTNWSFITSYSQIVKHGEKVEQQLFSPLIYKSAIIRDPLPNNLYLNNGWLLGTAINNTSNSIYFETIADVVLYNDNSFEVKISIGILAENMSIEDLSENDPILNINLQACDATFDGSWWSCTGPCPISTCQQCGAPNEPASVKDPALLGCGCGYHDCL